MQLGASRVSRPRQNLLDFNLLPADRRPSGFPLISIGLVLLLAGSVLLLYSVFYQRAYTQQEVSRLQARVNQGQQAVREATGADVATDQQRQRLLAMHQDYQALAERQIRWSNVLAAILATPPGVSLESLSQSGYTVTLDGTASQSSAVVDYLSRLRDADLFLNLSVQLSGESGPPGPPPTQPSPPTLPPAAPGVAPAAPTPSAVPTATPSPSPTLRPSLPSPQPSPSPATTATPLRTATITPSGTATATMTASPTPSPSVDYALVSASQITQQDPWTNSVAIRARVVDNQGRLVPGVRFRVSSEGWPAWSADGPDPSRADGTVEFPLSRGKFRVVVLDGLSDTAANLFTGANGVAGAYSYELVFRKTGRVAPVTSPTVTATPTPSATPLPTPVAPGRNVILDANVRAFGGPFDGTPTDANPVRDGDLNTVWNANAGPVVDLQVDLGRVYRLEGIEFVVEQSPAGPTKHELWLQNENGSIERHREFAGETRSMQFLTIRFSPVRAVRRIWMRTLSSPSFVAWREVRAYEELPQPGSGLTPASTSTFTPTVTPTVTLTPTITLTSTPVPGRQVALGKPVYPSSSVAPNDAGKANDGDVGTFWMPDPNDPQPDERQSPFWTVDLCPDSQNPCATIQAVELVVAQLGPGTSRHELWTSPDGNGWASQGVFDVALRTDGQVLSKTFTNQLTGVRYFSVRSWLGFTPTANQNAGWREVRVFSPLMPPTATRTVTLTPTVTFTPTSTFTPTVTPTGSITPLPTPTGTPISSLTPLSSANTSGLTITASSRQDLAGLAIDGVVGSPWFPSDDNRTRLQFLQIDLGASYDIEAVELFGYKDSSTTPAIVVRVGGVPETMGWSVAGQEWHLWKRFGILRPASLVEVEVTGGVMAWREVKVYGTLSPTATPTLPATETPAPGSGLTPASTSTFTPTVTPTFSPVPPSHTLTPTGTATPSPTMTPCDPTTCTPTPTQTKTPWTSTATPTPTETAGAGQTSASSSRGILAPPAPRPAQAAEPPGLGRGPGAAAETPTPPAPRPPPPPAPGGRAAIAAPASTQTGGPVRFTIVMELKSGSGYR
ncbi:MAG: PilN domain-containing protein [Chloroflexi bacterium]|nr:PilN domain-containing protein [Chloroflexota bacterium]